MSTRTGPTAIVLSGQTMTLGVVRALGAAGVPVVVVHYDEKDTAHTSRFVHDRVVAPDPEQDEAAFIDFLLRRAPEWRDGVLIPTSDESVVAASRHKARLEPHFRVACTSWEVTRRYIEKATTYSLARSAGVTVPWTLVPRSLQEAMDYASKCAYPCLLKPSQGHLFYSRFGKKMFRAEDAEQLIAGYRRATDAGLEVMLQEIIPGGDREVVNYNAYVVDGQPLVEFTARHIRNAPPQLGSPRVAVSEHIPEVLEPGRAVLRAIGFEGYACTEFRRDIRTGQYVLMEVNGRHNLSTSLAVRCGINFPLIHYRHVGLGEVPRPHRFRTGLYWIDIPRDVAYSIKHLFEERYWPWQYLAPYFRPHVFAICDVHDMRPFCRRLFYLAKCACRIPRRRLASLVSFRGRRRRFALKRETTEGVLP